MAGKEPGTAQEANKALWGAGGALTCKGLDLPGLVRDAWKNALGFLGLPPAPTS